MDLSNVNLGASISNDLSRGYYSDFEGALSALKAAYNYEKSCDDETGREFWDGAITDIDCAQEVYDRHMAGVKEKIVLDLRLQGLDQFADALESGDYSGLAY